MSWIFYFAVILSGPASGGVFEDQELLGHQDSLKQSESQVKDLKPGQEKTIVFANPEKPTRTPWVVVYLHGFSASRKEISPTVEILAEKLKANAFFTRLAGHGINSVDALKEIRMEAWEKDIEESLANAETLGEKTAVVATSTSATMILNLMAENRAQPDLLVLISPNFGFERWDSELLLWPAARVWVEWVMGAYREFQPLNPQHGEFWTTKYPYRATVEVMRAVQKFRKANFQDFQTPTLTLMNPKDPVVDPKKIKIGLERIQGPKNFCFKVSEIKDSEDAHILTGEILSPKTTSRVTELIFSFFQGCN